MTSDEAISIMNVIVHMLEPQYDTDRIEDAIEMAIKALEQEPCGNCISREAVENAIKHAEVNFTVNSDIDFTKHKREVQEIVNGIVDAQIKALRALPSVSPQPKIGNWIPVSERLPEIHQDVILSLRSLDVEVGCRAETEPYFYCHGVDCCYIDPKNVIAWMPLPLPYKQEVENG